jgi:hypothetical protein
LLVVSDLGGFKAFRIDNNQMHSNPRLELLQEFSNVDAHSRLVEKVSDLSGRFPRSTGAPNGTGAMSDGERHNIELEQRRRYVRQLAGRLNPLLRETDRCFLAASREIHRQLMDELEAHARAKIAINLSADLTKVNKSDLLQYFKPEAGASASL